MKRIVFAMLNPSKAGWPKGDLTVSKVCGFAARIFGYYPGDELEVVDGGAVFSDDVKYRYRLWRVLARRNAFTDELSRVVRIDVVNLSAWISTDPQALYAVNDPIGSENMRHIDFALTEADIVIAAWGSLSGLPAWLQQQAETVLRKFTRTHDVQCLGRTADGSPRHPSRLAYATALTLFRPQKLQPAAEEASP